MSRTLLRVRPVAPDAEGVGDLAVPRHRGLTAVGRVPVNVVTLAVPVEHAPRRHQRADQRAPLHTSRSTGSR